MLFVALAMAGCPPQPVPTPIRSPLACDSVPAVVSGAFCKGYFAGTSPCVLCFETAGVINTNPIHGCVLPNNQYCVDERGCQDARCARALFRAMAKDGGT